MARRIAFRNTTEARHAFRRAEPPMPGAIVGDWQLEHLGGDVWESVRGWRARALGTTNAWGLRFDGASVQHLLGKKARKLTEARPLAVELGLSSLDGGQAVVCRAAPDLGPVWGFVHYELRQLDDVTLIGLDVTGPARWPIPMPFLLHRHQT